VNSESWIGNRVVFPFRSRCRWMTMATSTGGVLRLPVNLAFKVLFEDWQNKLSDVRAFCRFVARKRRPLGGTRPSRVRTLSKLEFNTPETSWTRRCLKMPESSTVSSALASFKYPCRTGRSPNSGGSDKRRESFAAEVCFANQCGCRYSHSGLRFSVPACGHNSAENNLLTNN